MSMTHGQTLCMVTQMSIHNQMLRFHDQHLNWLMIKCAFQISWQYRWQTATNDQTCISWSHKCQHTNTTMWLIKCLDYQQTHTKCASHDHLSQLAFHMITQISLVHKCWFMTSYYFQQMSHGRSHKFWCTFCIKIVTEADVTIVIKIVIVGRWLYKQARQYFKIWYC